MKAAEVIAFAKERGVKMVDLKFVDLPGLWQHFSVPISELTDEIARGPRPVSALRAQPDRGEKPMHLLFGQAGFNDPAEIFDRLVVKLQAATDGINLFFLFDLTLLFHDVGKFN